MMATVPILSMRLSTEALALGVLIVVGPLTLIALVYGYVGLQMYRRFTDATDQWMARAWVLTRRVTLWLGFASWVGLTIWADQAPAGPRNETAAISNLRTLNTAEVTYLSGHGVYGDIPDLISAGLIDQRFEGPVAGYFFSVTASGSGYTATAFPVSTKTGKFGYYSGSDAVINYANDASPTCEPCFPKGMSGKPVY